MDAEAQQSCLGALRSVARAARACAREEIESPEYSRGCETAERALERADARYQLMRVGHAAHERRVRLVNAALVEGRATVVALTELLAEAETIDRLAAKLERAVARAGQ